MKVAFEYFTGTGSRERKHQAPASSLSAGLIQVVLRRSAGAAGFVAALTTASPRATNPPRLPIRSSTSSTPIGWRDTSPRW